MAPSYPYISYLLLRFVFQLYLGSCVRTVLFCARALFIYSEFTCTSTFSSLNNVLILLCVFFFLTGVLSLTVLVMWVAPPKMFYNWYRIYWSRNQLWNCTHFGHPTDEQLLHVDIFFN